MKKLLGLMAIYLFLSSCMNKTLAGGLIGMGAGGGLGATSGYFIGGACDGCAINSGMSDESFGALVGGIGGAISFGVIGAIIGDYFESKEVEEEKLQGVILRKKQNIDYGLQALFFSACRLGDVEIIEKLVEADERFLIIADATGKTGLHWTAQLGRLPATQFLVNRGVELDVRDDLGKTALHYSVLFKRVEVSEYLIEEGAGLQNKDNDSKIPMDYLKDNPQILGLEDLLRNDSEYLETNSKKFDVDANYEEKTQGGSQTVKVETDPLLEAVNQ